MLKNTVYLALFATTLSMTTSAQTTYLPTGTEDYNLLDRLETRSGELSPDLFLSVKPVSRKYMVRFLEKQQENQELSLSNLDRYNIRHAISVSGEWAKDENGAIDSKRPWFNNRLYKKQPDLVYVKTKDFFLSANPVLTASGIHEINNPDGMLFTSNRGLEARGWICKKLGFYTYFTDNQEQAPSYVADWVDTFRAVPGADFFTRHGNTYDYLLAKGYLDFSVIKEHINITFGYDKNNYGDGMRSLFLSDFGANYAFLRLNTRIWKLNYQNLYMELTPQLTNSINQQLPHKYATMHYLSVNATKWLNLGLFEGVIFHRVNRYEFGYMVPIILYRQVERALGSPDNVVLGINAKALAAKHLQFYGQLFLDEFTSKELAAGDGYWANKFGIQFGGKYFDAFGVNNLDVQGEINMVRPFTYAHFDSIANYTHYNQPLAHPLGASFAEITGIVRYQPVRNLYLSLKGMYYEKGADTASSNFGNNIFKDYDTRTPAIDGDVSHGYDLISGVKTKCALVSLNGSYELKENLFIDLGFTHRTYSGTAATTSTSYIQAGIRLNFVKRDYNFY
ncbi:hypothetical protein [Polluticoccus soli]|uniref:hypothetical protein n=1 Tax=Polluticoccus soli TaxID=3034150 RepID=UPI0023E1A710|nr:hypothetical protein [Flavipsychrobacter sp. JY13-12]